jgi:membrane-associated protein
MRTTVDTMQSRWKQIALHTLVFWLLAAAMTSVAAQDKQQPAPPRDVAAQHPVIEAAPPIDTTFWAFTKELLGNLFNSRRLMETLGKPEFAIAAFIAMNVIVFVETGLLVGFFLPGDSLLVTAGLIASNPLCGWNVWLLIVTLCISAIVGDSVGYSIGFKSGPKIFNREQSLFFHKDHLLKAQHFYESHGGKTIIIARFMPIIRTFAPVVAGVGRMQYARFLMFNVVGGIGWVVSMVLIGYYLPSVLNPVLEPIFGQGFLVQDHVEKIVIIVVLLSISPGIYVWLRSKFGKKQPHRQKDDDAAGGAHDRTTHRPETNKQPV